MSYYADDQSHWGIFDVRNKLEVFLPLNVLFLISIFISEPKFHDVQYFYQWILLLVMIVVFPMLNYFIYCGICLMLYIAYLVTFGFLRFLLETIGKGEYKEKIHTEEEINRINLIQMYFFWGGYFIFILGQCIYMFQGGTLRGFYSILSEN